MFVKGLVIGGAVGALILGAGAARAQEDLNRGKTPAQLYASDCADCHRNPRALTQRDNANSLANFLRVHYTASRESAAALAAYLVALPKEPQPGPGRASTPSRSRPAASQDQNRTGQAPPAAGKPSDTAAPQPAQPAQPAAETPAVVPTPPAAAPASPPSAPAAPAAPAGEPPAAATPPANPE